MNMKRTAAAIFTAILTLFAISVNNSFAAESDIFFSEDFETQTVGSIPTTVYHATVNNEQPINNVVSKTALSGNEIVVKKDTTTANATNYLNMAGTASNRGIQIFFPDGMDKTKGVIALEYDSWENIAGNAGDAARYVRQVISGKDRNTRTDCPEMIYDGGKVSGVNIKAFYIKKYLKDTNITHYDVARSCIDNTTPLYRVNNAWNHYKLEINLSDGTERLWVNGAESAPWVDEAIYKRIANGNDVFDSFVFVMGISYDNPWKLDNIKLYRPTPDIDGIVLNSYTGEQKSYKVNAGTTTLEDKVTTMLSDMNLKFGNVMNIDSCSIALKNNTPGNDENVEVNWNDDKRSAKIATQKGYLNPNCAYTLTVDGCDISGKSLSKPYVINFNSSPDGGLIILKTEFLKDDALLDPSTIKSGDTVTARITYILLNKDYAKENIILAITGENNYTLTGFKQCIVNFETEGYNSVSTNMQIGDTVPNKISVFLWSKDLRQSFMNYEFISTEGN